MNKAEMLLCAQIARAAYGQGYDINPFRLTGRFYNNGSDTQGIFGITEESLIIAFRGSEETKLADWIRDLKFKPTLYPYANPANPTYQVHFGFSEAYKSVRQELFNLIREASQSQIICTGHSLGAALATLCALDVVCNLPLKTVKCYTFGSPKVGNPDFVRFYNLKVPQTYRIVNGPDVVPFVPPDIPYLLDYDHVGQLHHIGDVAGSGLSQEGGLAHLPNNYIKALESLA